MNNFLKHPIARILIGVGLVLVAPYAKDLKELVQIVGYLLIIINLFQLFDE